MSHAKPAFVRLAFVAMAAGVILSAVGRSCPADGIAVLANRDDDDRDGRPDADDDRVNGAADERDLAAIVVPCPAGARLVRVAADDAPLRFFLRDGEGWRHLGLGRAELPVAEGGPADLTIHVEARDWAGMPESWTGRGNVAVTFEGPDGPIVVHDLSVCVAPVRLLPGTATVDEAFVATGRYDNAAFVVRLRGILEDLDVPLTVHPTSDWREMWMQDTMEIAVAATADSSMHVVLAGLRGHDSFPPTLLGPDVAVAEVAKPRPLAGGDAWADWYGNLEVSVPTAAHEHGRVIYGRNRLTDCSFHPDAIAFLAAQHAQPPVWIDTSWLLIKHTDEIVAFLPGTDGRGVILVPDPAEGLRLLGDQDAAEPQSGRRREANARIARAIDAMLVGDDKAPRAGVAGKSGATGLLELLGLDESRVVRLPVAFDVPAAGLLDDGGVTDASSLWSNPVNALVVNGTVICGSAGMPSAVQQVCRERFLAAGADRLEFIDDGVYQKNHGNVHCATNARRQDVRPPR
jgi:protein-arginine deiminase